MSDSRICTSCTQSSCIHKKPMNTATIQKRHVYTQNICLLNVWLPNLHQLHTKYIYPQKSLWTKPLYTRSTCIHEMSVSSISESPICKSYKWNSYIHQKSLWRKRLYTIDKWIRKMPSSSRNVCNLNIRLPNLHQLHAKFMYPQKSLWRKWPYKRDVCILKISVFSMFDSPICTSCTQSTYIHKKSYEQSHHTQGTRVYTKYLYPQYLSPQFAKAINEIHISTKKPMKKATIHNRQMNTRNASILSKCLYPRCHAPNLRWLYTKIIYAQKNL